MPPTISDSEGEEYSERTSSVGLNKDDQGSEGHQGYQESDEDVEDETKTEAKDREGSSEISQLEGNDENEENEEDDNEENDEGVEEFEDENEEDEEQPESDEDNYKLEDLDEIEEDLELREEEEDEDIQTRSLRTRLGASKNKDKEIKAEREPRKRKLALFGEEDEDQDAQGLHQLRSSRKSRRQAESQTPVLGIDQDLLLTDEETEYMPSANPDVSKMTLRQRARYLDNNKDEKIELNDDLDVLKKGRPKKKASDQEVALKKAESARRRNDHKMKALEEEKQDTLNKLLKRRSARTRENESSDTVVSEGQRVSFKERRPLIEHPALYRWANNASMLESCRLGYTPPGSSH